MSCFFIQPKNRERSHGVLDFPRVLFTLCAFLLQQEEES